MRQRDISLEDFKRRDRSSAMKSKGSLGVQEGVIRCVGPSGLRSTACIAFRGSTGDRHCIQRQYRRQAKPRTPGPSPETFRDRNSFDMRCAFARRRNRSAGLYKISLVYWHHDSGEQDTTTVRGRLGGKAPHLLILIVQRLARSHAS